MKPKGNPQISHALTPHLSSQAKKAIRTFLSTGTHYWSKHDHEPVVEPPKDSVSTTPAPKKAPAKAGNKRKSKGTGEEKESTSKGKAACKTRW